VIKLKNISKKYGQKTTLNNISFEMNKGEVLGILGHSGCGKTTLLKIISGLVIPDIGEIYLNNIKVNTPGIKIPPYKRSIGMVFQNLALWPHMTVFEHLDFVLSSKTKDKTFRRTKIGEMLHWIRLDEYSDTYPQKLSGGEKQRLAIARALINKPDILLLDEPMTGLDRNLRATLLKDIKYMIKKLEITTIYVSHYVNEALFISDRIIEMNNGEIMKIQDRSMFPHLLEQTTTFEADDSKDIIEMEPEQVKTRSIKGIYI